MTTMIVTGCYMQGVVFIVNDIVWNHTIKKDHNVVLESFIWEEKTREEFIYI